ncbi:MAG TPA: HAD family phosphatase [Motilibacteraceae bacterium]|nr:HAD family phosphatase [Motilibacteraceae bacterium]
MTTAADRSSQPEPSQPAPGQHGLKGLVVDWGGVLTSALEDSMGRWAEADDIDYDGFRQAMRELLGLSEGKIAEHNPVFALERGEIENPHFEQQLAARLRTRGGGPVDPVGLLDRMFEHFLHAPDMAGLVLRARRAGLRTGLLSNSWGNEYPREGWDEMFDVVVISGEVGMRKPEPQIYHHVADLLALEPSAIVFVDDLAANVKAAVELGFVGVRHTDYATTAAELEALFGIPLAE